MDSNQKNILSLDETEKVIEFFLKSNHYFNCYLPEYFNFDDLLKCIFDYIKINKNNEKIKNILHEAKKFEDVNYKLFLNKDGKYKWRLFQIINPVIYCFLVYEITRTDNWKMIKGVFKEFTGEENDKKNKIISCESRNFYLDDKKDNSKILKEISIWLEKVEEESIKQSLEYSYLTYIDITDCYGSIYTHSITWALCGDKKYVKDIVNKKCKKDTKDTEREKQRCLGDKIDKYLSFMSFGQTNGIPQGSILMDFIAEIVLGRIDEEISKEIKNNKLNDNVKIIRFRDDYRIFTNDTNIAKEVVKIISYTLKEWGMQLNDNKNYDSNNLILESIKPDKISRIYRGRRFMNNYFLKNKKMFINDLKYELLYINQFSKEYPNSGSIIGFLFKLRDKIYKIYNNSKILEKIEFHNYELLINILVDIMYYNPRVYNLCVIIIGLFIENIKDKDKKLIIGKIEKKMEQVPNTDYLDLWLQGISLKIYEKKGKNNNKCDKYCLLKLVNDKLLEDKSKVDAKYIWNFEWLEKLKDKKN